MGIREVSDRPIITGTPGWRISDGVLTFFRVRIYGGQRFFLDDHTGSVHFSKLGHTGYKDFFRDQHFFRMEYSVKYMIFYTG